MIEETSQGLYLAKSAETPKIWRAELDGKPVIEFEAWVSTEAIDRDGEILRMDGWRKASLQNPKFLLFHDYGGYNAAPSGLPIGKPYWTRQKDDQDIKKKGLFSRGRFGPQLWGLAVGELYLQGDMDSFSVGFNWFKRIFDEEGDGKKKPYFEYIDMELYEFSAVNVPSNPEAMIATERMIRSTNDLKDMMAIIKDFSSQNHEPQIRRDSYMIKESADMKKAIEQFADTNKRILDFMAKYEKHAISASELLESDSFYIMDDDDDIDIDLDDLLGSDGDALAEGGDISESDLVEMLAGSGDDAAEFNLADY